MTNASDRSMSDERKAKLRAGRLRSEAENRRMKHDLVVNREEYVNSVEFRSKFRTNSVVNKAMAIIDGERIKFKLNEDGTPMTIDDEIEFRRRKQLPLLKAHYLHLGIEPPAKKGADAEPVTKAELETLRPYLTDEEFAEMQAQVA